MGRDASRDHQAAPQTRHASVPAEGNGMSSIDIYAVLERIKNDWDLTSTDQAIDQIIYCLRKAEETGYLGTLYRTIYEVEGSGAFPIDMLRYTSSWPTGETEARAIEDSFESGGRRTITLTRHHRDPEPQVAADRWEAKFRWKVVRIVETVAL
jgi:hypothetical protein